MIPLENWSKDHWSLLAYVETRMVDHRGLLNLDHLRINTATHPHLLGEIKAMRGVTGWKPEYATKVRFDDRKAVVTDHDDWDCLEDLEAAGLVSIISEINAAVKLLPPGTVLAAKLRAHKGEGGTFAGFRP